jgi:hypothetical protein
MDHGGTRTPPGCGTMKSTISPAESASRNLITSTFESGIYSYLVRTARGDPTHVCERAFKPRLCLDGNVREQH